MQGKYKTKIKISILFSNWCAQMQRNSICMPCHMTDMVTEGAEQMHFSILCIRIVYVYEAASLVVNLLILRVPLHGSSQTTLTNINSKGKRTVSNMVIASGRSFKYIKYKTKIYSNICRKLRSLKSYIFLGVYSTNQQKNK